LSSFMENGEFVQKSNKLMDVLVKIDDISILKEIAVNHPRFGNLPLDQWIELLYLHEQRHIEQIKDLKAFVNTTLDL
jgi:hypothetical protein